MSTEGSRSRTIDTSRLTLNPGCQGTRTKGSGASCPNGSERIGELCVLHQGVVGQGAKEGQQG